MSTIALGKYRLLGNKQTHNVALSLLLQVWIQFCPGKEISLSTFVILTIGRRERVARDVTRHQTEKEKLLTRRFLDRIAIYEYLI
jgi:hypothetical protein